MKSKTTSIRAAMGRVGNGLLVCAVRQSQGHNNLRRARARRNLPKPRPKVPPSKLEKMPATTPSYPA